MKERLEFEEIIEHLKSIKNRSMQSNATFSALQLKELISKDSSEIIFTQNSLVILAKEIDFARLYFYSRDYDSLKKIPNLIKHTNEKIVCDIVGKKGGSVDIMVNNLLDCGFFHYATFIRMLCSNVLKEDVSIANKVEFAKPEDLFEISSLLHSVFDKYTAHFPDNTTIAQRIDDKEVFVVRDDDCIKGFTIFDSKNKKLALLDYVVVRDAYRRQGIGRDIFNFKLRYHNESKHYYLWINEKYKNFVSYHENNGFIQDGVVDHILMFKGGKTCC